MSKQTADLILREIHPLELTKASAEGHAEILADLVKDGNVNPLDMATRLRFIIAVCENTLGEIKELAVDEAEKFAKGEPIIINQATVTVSDTGTKYDYAGTGDDMWTHFNRMEKEFAKKRKEREEFLKNVFEPLTVKESFTGKEFTITPPKRTSSRSVKITFEK